VTNHLKHKKLWIGWWTHQQLKREEAENPEAE